MSTTGKKKLYRKEKVSASSYFFDQLIRPLVELEHHFFIETRMERNNKRYNEKKIKKQR